MFFLFASGVDRALMTIDCRAAIPRKQLSLSARKNCKTFKPHFEGHALRLQEALALELELQSKVDFLLLAERCDEGNKKVSVDERERVVITDTRRVRIQDCCGEVFFDTIMGGLVRQGPSCAREFVSLTYIYFLSVSLSLLTRRRTI